jgi:hypothetical protein
MVRDLGSLNPADIAVRTNPKVRLVHVAQVFIDLGSKDAFVPKARKRDMKASKPSEQVSKAQADLRGSDLGSERLGRLVWHL